MKILIAPDSFKGTMSSEEAGDIIAEAFRHSLPCAEILVIPMADGGEGTTEAVVRATGGTAYTVPVTGPFGESVDARYGLLPDGRVAVLEMASASGLELVSSDRLDPLRATTFGTGELMRSVLRRGVREIILGIGGSATVDGGAGMAQALGYRLLDEAGLECGRGGKALAGITTIDSAHVEPFLVGCRIRVACDVTIPLLGEHGAAAVFGPQKGATPAMVDRLESGLANLAEVWKGSGMLSSVNEPGDGAAGGLGAGLRAFCGAEIDPGARLIAEITGFDREIRQADILVTGEGRTDEQTGHGKLCTVLADRARAQGVRTVLISGAVSGSTETVLDAFDQVFAVSDDATDSATILHDARANLAATAARVGALIGQGAKGF